MAKPIKIIYASTSGNVEVVCEKVAEILGENKLDASLHRAEVTNKEVLESNEMFVLATSTWRHGEVNPFFDDLLVEIPNIDCRGKKAAYIGLGDFRYEPVLFNVGIDIVKEAFEKQGGEQIGKILKINGEPYKLLDTTVKKWTLDLIALLHA